MTARIDKPQVLFISPSAPLPPTSGGNQRTHILMNAISSVADVELLLMSKSAIKDPDHLSQLREQFGLVDVVAPLPRGRRGRIWPLLRPFAPRVVDRLAHNLGRRRVQYQPDPAVSSWLARRLSQTSYDLIVGRHLQPTAAAGALAFHPVIVDVDDLETEVYESRASAPEIATWRKVAYSQHLRQLRRLVPEALAKADFLWVAKEEDRSAVGLHRSAVIPNIPIQALDTSFAPVEAQPDSLIVLTVGSLNHRANVRGLDHFVHRIWPQVRLRMPQARFRIVGSRLSEKRKGEWSRIPGVEVVGFVDRLVDEYAACAFTVAPLFEGGGTNIKVLESLMHGRTCVVTPHAQRGYSTTLPDEESVLVASDDSSFAQACIRLLTERNVRLRLGARGQASVATHFTMARVEAAVRSSIEVMTQAGRGLSSESP